MTNTPEWLGFEREHVWHPYSTLVDGPPVYPVVAAAGCRIKLADGRELIDGMASWWSAIHGYAHPVLDQAIRDQLDDMAHVMFGGLTHEPAAQLAELLVRHTPPGLDYVFFADSGSVSVEVAIKMALQYRAVRGEHKRSRLLTISGGYHGDTFGAMAVCDPVTGMHSLFSEVLPQHHFVPRPSCRFGDSWDARDIEPLAAAIEQYADELSAVILEPIVQGAGGMWFYHPQYLRELRALCDRFGLLLIADEIATGFARSGTLFACDHAGISPDIMCLGKALTGGYMTLAATLANVEVAHTLSTQGPGVLMHGPTFMANPLACACAGASINLLLSGDWQQRIKHIEQKLAEGLAPARDMPAVCDVRVLGAIGVIELHQAVDMHTMPAAFVSRGVWVRPFGKLVYVMPPYVIGDDELRQLTRAMVDVVETLA